MKSISLIEVEVPRCSLTYGTAPCTATLEGEAPTGTVKCFNSLKTCQDRANFTDDPKTFRFAKGADYLPDSGIDYLSPSIKEIRFQPAVISLGKTLGQRASLTVTFQDERWADTGDGFDKYRSERPYNPYGQGTFWGKWHARQPYVRGRALRWIQGLLGQSVEDMETRHFLMENSGPLINGTYTITAKDPLKLATGDRAQAPKLSTGQLVGEIDADDVTATLSPTGIGNIEYPASGYVAIGRKEICGFTRSGDTLTLTRGQWNTVAAEHDAGEQVQLCLHYNAEDPAIILSDLLMTYAGMPSSYIPLSDWQAETEAYNRRVYTALIPIPTDVDLLSSELIEQAGLVIWASDFLQRIRLQVLRAIPTTAEIFDDSNIVPGSFDPREQPEKRVSRVQVFFGQINPLEGLKQNNFRSSALLIDTDAEIDYGSPAILSIYSRWIPFGGLTGAQRLCQIQLGRFRDAPRKFNFRVFRHNTSSPVLGEGCQISAPSLQTPEGGRDLVPVQLVSVNPGPAFYEVTAEEMRFVEYGEPEDPTVHPITIDANVNNINLRTLHDALFQEPVDGDTVVVTLNSGVIVGSASTTLPAINVGTWPAGVTIVFNWNGRVQGKGGDGGAGGQRYSGSGTGDGAAGVSGGAAFFTRYAVTVNYGLGAEAWGGGGGGGGGSVYNYYQGNGGGGGAGTVAGAGGPGGAPGAPSGLGAPGAAGTATTGGQGGQNPDLIGYPGFDGGDGGGPGLSGTAGLTYSGTYTGGAGGAAGKAIDGVSYLSITGTADSRGGEVN